MNTNKLWRGTGPVKSTWFTQELEYKGKYTALTVLKIASKSAAEVGTGNEVCEEIDSH